MPIAPDFDFVRALIFGFDDLAADSCRSLLTSPVPCSVGSIDVVEPRNGCLETALRPVFLTEHLGHEFLPTVASFGHRRKSVGLLQSQRVRIFLQFDIVCTSGGGEEITLGPGPIRRLNHMRVHQNAAQALHAEPLDEAHTSHVSREVINLDGIFTDPPTVVFVPQVQT